MDPLALVGSLAYGKALDGLFNRVDHTIKGAIRSATDGAIEVEIEAGKQIQIAIEQAKNAYQYCLEETVEKVGRAAKETFQQLDSMVGGFEKQAIEEMQDLKLRAQQLANTLPFANKQTQLTSISPQYLVIRVSQAAFTPSVTTSSANPVPPETLVASSSESAGDATIVKFRGNFPWVATKGFEPTLSFDGRFCFLRQSTIQELDFDVPSTIFDRSDLPTQYAYKTGILQAPWDNGWIWSHKIPGEFRVGLGALPESPGKIVVEYVFREHSLAVSVEEIIDGRAMPKNRQKHNAITRVIRPEAGWCIDISQAPTISPTKNLHGYHGDARVEKYDRQEITCVVDISLEDDHHAGAVSFNVTYHRTKEAKRQEEVALRWGESRVLQPRPGEEISRVIFDDYKGNHHEFGGPALDDGVLKVKAEGWGTWKITAEPPRDL